MKQPPALILFLSLLLVFILQTLGFLLAIHKPLWRDELNTQTYAINESYADILSGKNEMEGNTSPFFYIQQKIFCDIFHFQTPQPWLEGHWEYTDPFANIFLRILPVSWMSSFFLLLFLYFSFRFNIFFGFLGLFVGLASPMLWLYWAEARPYGLWVLLTALQMILFLEILHEKTSSYRKWLCLSLVNIFLSLTCILSFFQIGIVCVMLLFKERRWHQYILPFAIPMLFIYYYKPHSPSFDLIFLLTVQQMIFSTLPSNRLCILLIYPVLLRIYSLQGQKMLPKIFPNDDILTVFPFFLSILLMIIAIILFFATLQGHATGRGQYVIQRHIIFLIPVSIIGITYLLGLLWQSLKSYFWIKILIFIVIAGLLLFHIDNVWGKIYYLFTHNLYS